MTLIIMILTGILGALFGAVIMFHLSAEEINRIDAELVQLRSMHRRMITSDVAYCLCGEEVPIVDGKLSCVNCYFAA